MTGLFIDISDYIAYPESNSTDNAMLMQELEEEYYFVASSMNRRSFLTLVPREDK